MRSAWNHAYSIRNHETLHREKLLRFPSILPKCEPFVRYSLKTVFWQNFSCSGADDVILYWQKKYLSPARVMRSARNQSYSVINNEKPPIGSISKLFGRNISLFGDIHEKLDFSNFESYLFQNTKFFSLFRYVFDNHLTGYFTTLNIQHPHKNLIKKIS